MFPTSGLEALASGAILSPFTLLRRLLDGVEAGHERSIDLTLGEPRETGPSFLVDKLAEAAGEYAKYPPIRGTEELRGAIAKWFVRRYGAATTVDPGHEILPLNGSREGLFYAALPAAGRKRVAGRPAVLLPNPYYGAYIGAALAVGADPIYLNATEETGHLPDLDRLEADPDLLDRTVAFYLCSPANPQGAVADAAYVRRALALARRHDFILMFDECYSEIYSTEPPPGGLEVAATTPERYANIVVFNSLSKRSNLPGLRSGFVAGDAAFIESFAEVRNLVAPQVPGPTQHASAAIWAEEQHVAVNRQAYRVKFDICDEVLGNRLGYRRPAGGFFLWLDMEQLGGGEAAAVTLWKRCGVKVIPGAYLAQPDARGINPGTRYVRVALVQDAATIREALKRIVALC
jgi:aspartate/methionine/tyrosine aminotransferase